jgi:hypothetical protein
MSLYIRKRKRWTVNECLALQREFELLQLSIDEIAMKHKRTPNAIMFKLSQEGFADYKVLCSEYRKLNSNKCITEENSNVYKYEYAHENKNEDKDEANNEVDDECKDDTDDLKTHIIRLGKQISTLTEMFMMQNKNNKSFLSLFD